MCICNSLLGGLSTSCVTPLGKDSWTLSFDFPGLGTRPILLCTYLYILTHHSHDYMKIPIANHWVWEWSWGPSPTTQPAKIVVFALKRDGPVGITQLLKVSLSYLLLSLKSLGWEPQMHSGPPEHSQLASPSPPNQDSNVFPRRGKGRKEGRVDTEWRACRWSVSSSPWSWALSDSSRKPCTAQGDLEAKDLDRLWWTLSRSQDIGWTWEQGS